MKRTFALFLLLVSYLSSSQSLDTLKQFNYNKHFDLILKETQKKESNYYYPKQLKKYQQGEEQTPIEVLSMLIAFTEDKHYAPYSDIFFKKDFYDLNEEQKYEQVVKESEKILKDKPFLIGVINELKYAYRKLENDAQAEKCVMQMDKIFDAMMFTSETNGTGLTTPIFALAPDDGQYYIKMALRSKIGDMGSGFDKNGNFLDMLATTLDGKEVTLYFIIPHATKKMFKK